MTIRDAVTNYLTPAKSAEIANAIGYDTRYNFTRSEYGCFVEMTTRIVLERLKAERNVVQPMVDEILSQRVCQVDCEEDFGFPCVSLWFEILVSSFVLKFSRRHL